MWKRNQNIDEVQLIQGCINNDRKFQRALYELYFEKMASLIRRYTSDEDQQLTIINNGFLKIYKNISSFKREGSFEGWIRKIMYRSVADFFRSKRDNLKFIDLEDTLNEPVAPAETLDALFKEDILKVLETLPERTMRVFVMYIIEGYSHKEIGIAIGIPENTSKWHLSSAKSLLKEKLSGIYYQNKSS